MRQRQERRRPAWGKLAAIGLACAALAAAWRFTPLASYISPHRIMAFARMAGAARWAPLAVAAAYIPAAFLMFPRPLLTLFAVVAFGVAEGFACALAGVLAAALASYYIGSLLPDRTIRRLAGVQFERVTPVLREHGVVAIFAANMVPVPPFVVQGIMAGAIRIRLWQYTLGTLLSLLPGLFVAMAFGHQLSSAFRDASAISYAVLALTVAGMLLAIFFGRRWFARQAAQPG